MRPRTRAPSVEDNVANDPAGQFDLHVLMVQIELKTSYATPETCQDEPSRYPASTPPNPVHFVHFTRTVVQACLAKKSQQAAAEPPT